MNTNPNVITRVERAFVGNVPAAPLANATVVLFATHPCNLGTDGIHRVSQFANPDGQAIAVAPDAIETLNVVFALHDKISAANGMRAYQTLDGGATWIETDMKGLDDKPTIGSGAAIQVPVLAAGEEWAEVFHTGRYRGIAILYTAGAVGPTDGTGWALAISAQYAPQGN